LKVTSFTSAFFLGFFWIEVSTEADSDTVAKAGDTDTVIMAARIRVIVFFIILWIYL
jgi:hypothetical protein